MTEFEEKRILMSIKSSVDNLSYVEWREWMLEGTISQTGMCYAHIGNGVFSIKVFGLINAVIVSENKLSVIFKETLSSPYRVSLSNKENLPILANHMSPYGFDLASSDDDKPIKFFERVEVVVL